ncbi:pentapeptide repeat-containing protein [Secundilactobacillus kimchicus]|uniref:pentapeptide repeat-containing protein n=1 Tax=Secundilactobacillus kimchicus TaxID=528209 RepID=UPI0024A936E6|nr:pentapeptide repeat-containing protein [Secundilactobacillus kimchicus]
MQNSPEYPVVTSQTLSLDDLQPAHHYKNCTLTYSNMDVRLSELILDHYVFQQTNFHQGEWLDCQVSHCQSPNADFSGSHVYRCQFEACQLVSTDWTMSRLKQVTFTDSQASYCNFSETELDQCHFVSTRLEEAAFQAMTVRNSLTFTDCQLLAADFSDSALKRVDFRTSTIDDLRFTPALVRGCRIDAVQALPFALALGVEID